ncbi:hypothetical protein [Yersinia phage MHG19]|nr:hypothetical protein [Yersinia phage MHG19]
MTEAQIQQVQQQIAEYKIRLFDTQEAVAHLEATNKELQGALGEIATHLGLTPNDEGAIMLTDVVAAVKARIGVDAEVEGEAV